MLNRREMIAATLMTTLGVTCLRGRETIETFYTFDYTVCHDILDAETEKYISVRGYKVYLMGDSDYIAAETKEQALAWYKDWIGVVPDECEEVHMETTFRDFTKYEDNQKPDCALKLITVADAIIDHIKNGRHGGYPEIRKGKFPIYLFTDGHYC